MKKFKEILNAIKAFLIKNKYLIGSVFLASTLLVPLLSYPVFGRFESKINEKRDKEPFPTSLDDDFGAKFDKYYSDRTPYRDTAITLYNDFDFLLASAYTSVAEKMDKDFLMTYNDVVLLGKDKWLFYKEEHNDMLRINVFDEGWMWITDDIDRMIKDLEKMGKRVAFMVCPNKSTLYPEYVPNYYQGHEGEITLPEAVQQHFELHNQSPLLYPLHVFEKLKENEQLYYKYDTHYNDLGAMVAYQEIVKHFNDELYEYDFSKTNKVREEDLTRLAGISNRHDNVYSVDYREDITYKQTNDSEDIKSYVSTNPNNRKVTFIGDSYRSAMMRYIVKDYTYTTSFHIDNVIDYPETYLSNQDFIESDTVIFVSVERLFSYRFTEQEIYKCGHRKIADYLEAHYLQDK